MATLEARNGWYRIVFRLEGEKLSRSLNTQSKRSADACLARVKDNLHRYDLGLLPIPDQGDIVGTILGSPLPRMDNQTKPRCKSITIKYAWKTFQDTLPANSLEPSTLSGMNTHVDHLARLIGKRITLAQIDKPELQQYVDRRSKDAGRYGNTISVQTIKKELRTLSTIWGWMKDRKMIGHAFPGRRLRFPKYHDKPPFQTWRQIESQIKRGGLSEYQIRELWDALFLNVREIEAALAYAKSNARHDVIHPMLCFAAFTGARRSEILRSELVDLDFESSTITIREKKRMRGKHSTRRVPMQPKLRVVLDEWLSIHPGSPFTFATTRNQAAGAEPVSNDQASNFFEKTFIRSKWGRLHGWHVFRHSFCSNCAAAGVDQRVVMNWVGHSTIEMMRRYLHLYPSNELHEIEKVFS